MHGSDVTPHLSEGLRCIDPETLVDALQLQGLLNKFISSDELEKAYVNQVRPSKNPSASALTLHKFLDKQSGIRFV